jgi:hypothetical protein
LLTHPPNHPYEEACRLLTLVSQGVVLEAIAPLDESDAAPAAESLSALPMPPPAAGVAILPEAS